MPSIVDLLVRLVAYVLILVCVMWPIIFASVPMISPTAL